MTNHIVSLQAQIVAKDAEIQALHNGLSNMWAYLCSEKFSQDNRVNRDDVLLRMREMIQQADFASNAAYMNELGPKPVASYKGWACPECQAPLQDQQICNDTDAKAEARMREHWTAVHKVAG